MVETQLTVEQKLTKAMLDLRQLRPFYSGVYEVMEKSPSTNIESISVSLYKILYNETYLEQTPYPKILYGMLHAVSHIALRHISRREQRDPEVWNQACDLYVNKLLSIEFNIPAPGYTVKIGNIEITMPVEEAFHWNLDLENDFVEKIYRNLLESQGKDGKSSSDGSNNPDNPVDGEDYEDNSKQSQGNSENRDQEQENDSPEPQENQEENAPETEERSADITENPSKSSESNGQNQQNKNNNKEEDQQNAQNQSNSTENNQQNNQTVEKNSDKIQQNSQQVSEDSGEGEAQESNSAENIQSSEENNNSGNSKNDSGSGDGTGGESSQLNPSASSNSQGNSSGDLVSSYEDQLSQERQAEKILKEAMTQTAFQQETLDLAQDTSLLRREVEKSLTSYVDWRKLLRQYLRASDCSDLSYSTPDKRFFYQKMILPGTTLEELNAISSLKVCIDTSGSISQGHLSQFLGQVWALCKEFHLEGEIIYWDTQIERNGRFEDYKNIKKVSTMGGGGTDANCLFEYFESRECKEKPRVILIFTDGFVGEHYAKVERKRKFKHTIWVMSEDYNRTFSPAFGKKAVPKFL